MELRERIENNEDLTLIPQAIHSNKSMGRELKEKYDSIRTCFMIDRDRIIHCKSFRRLKHKTQVYIRTFGDHYRTRLTHTLDVAQIGRTIGIGIGLNEMLIEAIALGHDLGHVAFAHNEQSVRVVKKLEKSGVGLNLTAEVLDGILNHSGLSQKENVAKTLEGRVVKYSDKIAYLNHDIDDSIRAGLLTEDQLPKEVVKVLGKSHSERIKILVNDMIIESTKNLKSGNYDIKQSNEVKEAMVELRKFMFKNIYLADELKEERNKAKFILSNVINYFYNHSDELPQLYKNIINEEGLKRGVADYIAGMTDDYCLSVFNKIYVPKFVIY